ncbi:MAG TPA: hypothetical protein VEB22_09525 [Phycisphaerales bacterium]|nr:hypothetical protein [Phycisphaerales bacterium]
MAKATVKKIGRKRRAAGWTLLTLGVIVAGVWVASGWWLLRVTMKPWDLHAENGVARFFWSPKGILAADGVSVLPPRSKGTRWAIRDPFGGMFLSTSTDRYDDRWWKTWAASRIARHPKGGKTPLLTDSRLVLWPIPLLLWTPAALLIRSGILARRRALKGMCPKCGYSLAGLSAGAACPECGKPSSSVTAQDSSLKTSS